MLILWLSLVINDTYVPEAAAEVLESAAQLSTNDVGAILAVLAYTAEAEMMRN
jgi:hypothetical protein